MNEKTDYGNQTFVLDNGYSMKKRNSDDSTESGEEEHYTPHGLGWFVTALFILGDMVGWIGYSARGYCAY
ncbi:unnamed protein product [Bursaphelenchus okinawaensis]|uniref:Uncharacterized protein n=1 Tax=Bursaphelenchus okinawaensis TaxID=465554 RepID=A0A811KUJ5_9BILA|nr:unnamed protein product [Bursaphelenchus okinawaensis]CAG9113488.1 unnamed protein product [Bursaphelenchus okinawaensis]